MRIIGYANVDVEALQEDDMKVAAGMDARRAHIEQVASTAAE